MFCLRPVTHAPKTGSRNRRYGPKFDARFRRQFFCADARLLTSLTAFVHRREKLAPESGVEFMATVSTAYVRGLTVMLGN